MYAHIVFKWHSLRLSHFYLSTMCLWVSLWMIISSPVIGRCGWVWLSSPVIGRRGWVWLYTSTLNLCTQNVQLKVGLINKSLMGVHALYRNTCHLQQYSTAKHLVWAKCVHKYQQKHCNWLKFALNSKKLVTGVYSSREPSIFPQPQLFFPMSKIYRVDPPHYWILLHF